MVERIPRVNTRSRRDDVVVYTFQLNILTNRTNETSAAVVARTKSVYAKDFFCTHTYSFYVPGVYEYFFFLFNKSKMYSMPVRIG